MATYYPITLNQEGNGFSVMNAGTAPTPCVITIIPKVSFETITMTGLAPDPITLTDLRAGDIVIIDGEQGLFTINNQLAWNKFDGWTMPRLAPGLNEIEMTNASLLNIEIAYDLRYI